MCSINMADTIINIDSLINSRFHKGLKEEHEEHDVE